MPDPQLPHDEYDLVIISIAKTAMRGDSAAIYELYLQKPILETLGKAGLIGVVKDMDPSLRLDMGDYLPNPGDPKSPRKTLVFDFMDDGIRRRGRILFDESYNYAGIQYF
jgi:hypothetical protein